MESIPLIFSSKRAANFAPANALQTFLKTNPQVQFIQLQWQDYSGLLRGRIITKQYCTELLKSKRCVRGPAISFHCIVDNTLIDGVDPTGTHEYHPDWTSLRLAVRNGHPSKYATMMCSVVEKTPLRPMPCYMRCPRMALAKVLHTASDTFNLNFLVSFEVEVMFMSVSDIGFVPFSTSLGHNAIAGLRDPSFQYVEEIASDLVASQVCIQGFHSKGRRGQYQFTLGPLPPMDAADQLIFVHDIIKGVAAKHGYTATMSPRPVPLDITQSNGQHTQISIIPTDEEESFLAGILGKLPIISAFALPYDASYQRYHPYVGGDVIAWGTENRAVPIRKIKSGHWEIRCIDSMANSYLTLAVILSAGLLGIRNREPLKWTDSTFDPDGLEKAEKLPRALVSAIDLLQKNMDELEDMISSDLIRHYIFVKRSEIRRMRDLRPETSRNLLVELF